MKIKFLIFNFLFLSVLLSTQTWAHYNLLEAYSLRLNPYYQNQDPSLTPIDGSIISESPFLRNIYHLAEKKSPQSQLAHALFNSVDGYNLNPTQSQSSVVPLLNASSIGSLLHLTQTLQNEIKSISEMKKSGSVNFELQRDFLAEKILVMLRCDQKFDTTKMKEFHSQDHNPQICLRPEDRVIPQVKSFFTSSEHVLTAMKQKALCFENLSTGKLRPFLKIYLNALIDNRIDQTNPLHKWQNFPQLPEKMLLALFTKKAQASALPNKAELTALYQGQFLTKDEIKLVPFGEADYLSSSGMHFTSEQRDELNFFKEIYQKRLHGDLPPLGSYTETQYEIKNVNKEGPPRKEKFSNCGETSLLNFFNTIFRDQTNQRVSPEVYHGQLKWKQELIEYYHQHRSYSVVPGAKDHEEFAKVVSALPQVKYLRPAHPEVPVCELNAGLDNILRVFENMLELKPKYQKLTSRSEKLDFLFRRLSRKGFELDWELKAGREKTDIDKINTEVNLVISINNQNKLDWFFGKNHFVLKEIPGASKKNFLDPMTIKSTSRYFPYLQGHQLSQEPQQDENWIYLNLSDNEIKKALLFSHLKSPLIPHFALDLLSSLPLQDPLADLARWSYLQKFATDQNPLSVLKEQLKNYDLSARKNFPIRWASKHNHPEVVKYLLAAKDQQNHLLVDPAAKGNTPIREAAEGGHTEVVKLLLAARDENHRFRVNPAANENAAIGWACEYGYEETVRILLEAQDDEGHFRVDPSDDESDTIRSAARKGHAKIVAMLIAAKDQQGRFRVNLQAQNNQAIFYAAMNGYHEIVKDLIMAKDENQNYRLNQTDDLNLALSAAAANGRDQIVQILLNAKDEQGNFRTDPGTLGNVIIQKAAGNGHAKVVELLLAAKDTHGRYRVDPTTEHNWALKMAAGGGHVEVVRQLLAFRDETGNLKVNPAAVGSQALKWAAENGRNQVVELLLTAVDDEGNLRIPPGEDDDEALRLAVTKNHLECIKVLLAATDSQGRHRTHPEVRNNWILKMAAQNDNYEVMDLILQSKDQQGHFRVNPLGLQLQMKRGKENYQLEWGVRTDHFTPITFTQTDKARAIRFYQFSPRNFFKWFEKDQRKRENIIQERKQVSCKPIQCTEFHLDNGDIFTVDERDANDFAQIFK